MKKLFVWLSAIIMALMCAMPSAFALTETDLPEAVNWTVKRSLASATLNVGDGDVDLMDAMLILRYDCGWDVVLV